MQPTHRVAHSSSPLEEERDGDEDEGQRAHRECGRGCGCGGQRLTQFFG